MAAIASITLNDGASTPVAHTFSPVNKGPDGVALWKDRSSGISLGFPAVSLSVRAPSKASRNYKVTAKVVVPTLDVTSPSTSTGIQPAVTKAYDSIAVMTFTLSERTTELERTHLLAYVTHLLANANLVNAVKLYEDVY